MASAGPSLDTQAPVNKSLLINFARSISWDAWRGRREEGYTLPVAKRKKTRTPPPNQKEPRPRSLGARIRKLRHEREMSQRSLEEALGLGHGVVAQWELKGDEPELRHAVALSRQFGISVEEMCKGIQWWADVRSEWVRINGQWRKLVPPIEYKDNRGKYPRQ